jgi:hypothetical protein
MVADKGSPCLTPHFTINSIVTVRLSYI